MTDAADLIFATVGGKTFKASRRSVAHLLWTVERLERQHPAARLVIIQGSYNTGVAASAGTHDKDAVYDVQIVGMDWPDAQRFLRASGWAAWVREPPLFGWHIHMISLGYPGEVGSLVPGQVADYKAHRDGLASHAADNTWHPADIDGSVFNYDEWVEAHMPLNAEDKQWIDGKLDDLRKRINDIAEGERTRDAAERERDAADRKQLDDYVAALEAAAADDPTAEQVDELVRLVRGLRHAIRNTDTASA